MVDISGAAKTTPKADILRFGSSVSEELWMSNRLIVHALITSLVLG